MARILLVDDNAPLLAIMDLALQHEGHETKLAANGREALELVATGEFDLVITDLFMPEKEGLETILELRKKHPAIRIVAMSGGAATLNGTQMLKIAQKMGASLMLEKPFTHQTLIAAVDSVLKS